MTTETGRHDPPRSWSVLRGPATPDELRAVLTEIAAAHDLDVRHAGPQTLILAPRDSTDGQLTLRWQSHTPTQQGTLGHVRRPDPHLEILIDPGPGTAALTKQILSRLSLCLDAYSDAELDQITATMPLVARYATPDLGLDGWALIFRDHYVENTVGFLLGAQRAGIPPAWIYALAKGDRTLSRDRVHATLLARGYASGVLDNTVINDPGAHTAELARATAAVDVFIDTAHDDGRRVLVIDDGGLLARGYGREDTTRCVDAAMELTVSGLKRIAAAGPVDAQARGGQAEDAVNGASVIGGAVVLQRVVFEDLLIDCQDRDRAAVTGLVGVEGGIGHMGAVGGVGEEGAPGCEGRDRLETGRRV
jgi:hypothetical protein